MRVGVFGAGAWGTAVAVYLRNIGHDVVLVPKFEEQAEKMRIELENVDFLPGIKIPKDIQITTSVPDALKDIEIAFLAVPSIGIEGLCKNIKSSSGVLPKLPILLSLCKGAQNDELETVSDIVNRFLPNFEYGVLAGPTNAKEFAKGCHAAMVLATSSDKSSEIQKELSSDQVRIYVSDDVKGVELGGYLKNVYAIGAGICDGLKLGDNAKAAYLTRSFRELVMIGTTLGGKRETFYGLSGFGDFIATCMGEWSRNRTFGEKIGDGKTVDEIFLTQKAAVEGYKTTKALYKSCKEHGLDTTIIDEIYFVLYEGKPANDAMKSLLMRPLKAEN